MPIGTGSGQSPVVAMSNQTLPLPVTGGPGLDVASMFTTPLRYVDTITEVPVQPVAVPPAITIAVPGGLVYP
jgi:hypothetical protein